MAISQVTVPYLRGYDYGVGAMLASGSPMGKVVEGEVSNVRDAHGAVVDFQVQRIQTTHDLETALGINVEASYGCASFGAGVSARFSFAKTAKVQSSSLFMTVSASIELEFNQIVAPRVAPLAVEIIGRPEDFERRYGNMFVRGIARGGFFVGILRVDTMSTNESNSISSELEGSYGLFSADAKLKFDSVLRNSRADVFVRMYHEGGPIDLEIRDPTSASELLENANRFLKSFQEAAGVVARPFAVTLSPIEIARGPLPPNAAEAQRAQDVIIFCATRRSALLDQLNLLQFISDNQSKFDFSNGADIAAIRKTIADTQVDLELIAECASAAMNSARDAKLPAVFAESQHKTFPLSAMPAVLPVPIGVVEQPIPKVIVPDFRGCANWQECVSMGASVGLIAKLNLIPGVLPGRFLVQSSTPDKGSVVDIASIVTILAIG